MNRALCGLGGNRCCLSTQPSTVAVPVSQEAAVPFGWYVLAGDDLSPVAIELHGSVSPDRRHSTGRSASRYFSVLMRRYLILTQDPACQRLMTRIRAGGLWSGVASGAVLAVDRVDAAAARISAAR